MAWCSGCGEAYCADCAEDIRGGEKGACCPDFHLAGQEAR